MAPVDVPPTRSNLGETDFRLIEGSNERIQLEALLAHFALIGQELNKK